MGLETFTYTYAYREENSGNGEEMIGLERLKQCLTEVWCLGESNSVREIEGENRI